MGIWTGLESHDFVACRTGSREQKNWSLDAREPECRDKGQDSRDPQPKVKDEQSKGSLVIKAASPSITESTVKPSSRRRAVRANRKRLTVFHQQDLRLHGQVYAARIATQADLDCGLRLTA